MKCLKKINVLVAIFIIAQMNYCAMYQQQPAYNQQQQSQRNYQQYRYNKNVDHAHLQAADRLTNESYITPEMQWAVLSLLGKKEMTINTITGAVQDIPSIDTILSHINKKLDNQYSKPITYAEKEAMKNAINAMLEATDLAIFVAAVEAAYRNQQYTFYQNIDANLMAKLKNQRIKIQNALTMVNALQPNDQPSSASSYFSWLTGSNAQATANYYGKPLHFANSAETVTIPADLMQAIIAKNNYKQEPTAMQAANLLFKECFIAQQHHLKDALWIDQITINLQNPITPENYIFTHFPDLTSMCQIAQNLVATSPMRINLQDRMTQEQAAAHQLLLHMRQAIQTAMYIANAKSSYNVSYILPTAVVSYLGGIVNQLLVYDAQLSTMCKDPMYGATQEDTYRDEQWANINKYIAGAAITAAVVGTAMLTAPVATAAIAAKGVAAAGTAAKGAYGVYNTVAGVMPNVLGVAQAKDNESSFQTVKRYTDAVGAVGGKVALATGGAAFFANEIKKADQAGYIPLNEIHPNARAGLDSVINYGSKAALVSGTAAAVGGLVSTADAVGTAWNNKDKAQNWWYDEMYTDSEGKPVKDPAGNNIIKESSVASNIGKVIWHGTSAGYQAKNVVGGALGTVTLASQYFGSNAQQAPANNYRQPGKVAPTQAPAQPEKITTEKLVIGLTNLIVDKTNQQINPLPAITEISQQLLSSGAATPEQLQQAFGQIEQNLNLPANAIITGIQNLANNAPQPAQAQ